MVTCNMKTNMVGLNGSKPKVEYDNVAYHTNFVYNNEWNMLRNKKIIQKKTRTKILVYAGDLMLWANNAIEFMKT